MIISIREAQKQLPVSYQSLLNWSKNPSHPLYPCFLRIGNKIAIDLTELRAIALEENRRRVIE